MRERALYEVSRSRVWVQIEALAEALLEHLELSEERAKEVCQAAYWKVAGLTMPVVGDLSGSAL
jgi:hypothetical protein